MRLFPFLVSVIVAAVTAVTVYGEQVILKVKSQGCPVPVESLNPATLPRYVDTLEIGSGEHNWGGPFAIGVAANGDSIYVGYDYNLLMHEVTLGDSIVATDISLIFSDIDPKTNSAVMSRGLTNIKKVDFADPDFVNIVRRFISPQPGYHYETYSYGMSGLGDIATRRTIGCDLSDEPAARRSMLQMVAKIWEHPNNYSDTIVYVDREVNSLKDLVERNAEQLYRQTQRYDSLVAPLPAFTMRYPMDSFTDVVQFIPVYDSPSYMTLMRTANLIYPAGGGRSSDQIYTTFAKKDNREIAATDLFEPKRLNDVKMAFITAVSEQMSAENRSESTEGWIDDSDYSPAAILDAFITEEWTVNENQRPYQTDIEAMTLPSMAAITPEGIIFSYPGEIFTMFGETGYFTQLVTWDKIAPMLKPTIRKEIKHLYKR